MMTAKKIVQAISLFLLPLTAHAAEFEVHPIISVAEEFTDNVFETRDNRLSDFITRAMPGISLMYRAPALESDITYQYDYRYYARNSRDDDSTHYLTARGHLTVLENALFLDVTDRYERVSLDVARDVTRESLFVDQVDRNIATVSPYLLYQPNNQVTLKTGYTFSDTRYFDVQDVALSRQALDKRRHNGTVEAGYDVTSQLSVNAGYSYTNEESDQNDYDQHQPYGGFRYEYAESSNIFAQGGNTWISYDNGMELSDLFWHLGISHNFEIFTAFLRSGVRYDEDPLQNITQETFVIGGVKKEISNGSIDLDAYYSEFDETRTDGGLIPLVLPENKYGATIRGQRELLTNLVGSIAFNAEKYEYDKSDIRAESWYLRRFLLETSLVYQLREQTTISLWHSFTDYHSPQSTNPRDNSLVNRVSLQFRTVF